MKVSAPMFFCPFPAVLNPHVDDVEKDALTWLAGTGLSSTSTHSALAATNSAEFYARVTPAASPERLLPAVNWCYWGFGFDDQHCDRPGLETAPFLDIAARVLRAVHPAGMDHSDADPYVRTVAEIAGQFRRFATPTQMRRWANAHHGWLTAAAWQLSNALTGKRLTVADYLAVRLNACAGEPTTAMIEMVNGAEVPAAEMDSPAVLAATESARMVAALDNDLVSRHKESRLGHIGGNLVDIIADEWKCGENEAVRRAVALRDRVMSLFLRLHDQSRRRGSEELRSYLTGLGSVIKGNIEWSLRVPRYGRDEHVRWASVPSDANAAPLPVPAISWWWQYVD